MPMVVIETAAFARAIVMLLDDDDYASLQRALVENPKAGKVIPGTRGLRKMRWGSLGRGKRGGIRIVYYWLASKHQIYMLLAYAKSNQEDLTPNQTRALARLVEKELGGE
jgi:mRNA-degrading endonuclease RelE of RelBE toxin-antitoxin system